MPRWASRITLEVTGVRVERLHDISEEDARAEGIGQFDVPDGPAAGRWYGEPGAESREPIVAFARLWDSVNGTSHPWPSNCWVWAITFRRIEDHNPADH